MESKLDLKSAFDSIKPKELVWKKADGKNLDFIYTELFSKPIADELYRQLKKWKFMKVKRNVNPKVEWPKMSRLETIQENEKLTNAYICRRKKRSVFRNKPIRYDFTETPFPGKPWIPALELTRNLIERITKYRYNCVIINKYKNGIDHLNEYSEDEDTESFSVPFAILSLGGTREFILRQISFNKCSKDLSANNLNQVKIIIQHGSLILVNPLHYKQWHHALPRSYTPNGTRMSLTFKRIAYT